MEISYTLNCIILLFHKAILNTDKSMQKLEHILLLKS